MKISIIGTGYVGLVSGVCLAEKGLQVTCIDIDEAKVNSINKSISPIHEEGLESLLEKNISNKQFIASTNLESAVIESELSLITVGTPFDGHSINLGYIKDVAKGIGMSLKKKDSYHTVVMKSTVIPGTTEDIVLPIIEKYSEKTGGKDFGVVMNPEFLREGCAINDFMNPDRIVIGSTDKKAIEKTLELYSAFESVDKVITNTRTAEMIKYTANSFFATLNSFSNEIGNICALTKDVDVKDVMRGLYLDNRLSPILPDNTRVKPGFLGYLTAGCGFGGSCFPKDVKALISYAKSIGEFPILLESVININQNQPYKLIQLLRVHHNSFERLKVAILGLAFKPGTSDMRESPAIPIIKELLQDGAFVKAYDPMATEEAKNVFSAENIEYPENLSDALSNVDVIILITEWENFNNLSVPLNESGQYPLLIDGCRILNKNNYSNYIGVGLNE